MARNADKTPKHPARNGVPRNGDRRAGGPYIKDLRRSYVEDYYPTWVRINRQRARDLRHQRVAAEAFAYRPPTSLLMVVRSADARQLRRALDSVLAQTYGEWELQVCAAETSRLTDETLQTLAFYEKLDSRIKVWRLKTEEAGGVGEDEAVCRATNLALSRAGGEYAGVLGCGDALSPDALYEVVRLLQDHRDADLVYADEDRIRAAGQRHGPHFKPDWSPELLDSFDYVSRLGLYRRSLLGKIGGFREGFEGWHGYDLALRFTERADSIHHVPKVLYHRGDSTGEDGDAADIGDIGDGGRRALAEALARRGLKGAVEDGGFMGALRVRAEVFGGPKVSVIIPTRNNYSTLKTCLESIRRRTDYPNYEVLLVDNASDDPETVAYLASLPHRVIRFGEAFNYSRINNLAVSQAAGEYILLLNDDTEVISDGWMEEMLRHAQRPEVGAVGAKLLYPDGRIQHAGVLVGVGNPWGPSVATHAYQFYPADATGHAGAVKTVRNYSAVTGACMMLRREVFEEVGGFDEENLRVSFNDVDLCLKLRGRGFRNVYTPYAELYHHESVSRGYESNPSENVYMMERWGPELDYDPYYNPNFATGSSDFNLRSDNLRPKLLSPEGRDSQSYAEAGERYPLLMEPEERQAYIEARRKNSRNSRKTSSAPASPEDHFASALSNDHRPVERLSDIETSAETPSERVPLEDSRVNFFIIGQPKSGTSWVRSTLDSHPEIACLGEGKFFGRDFKTGNPSSGGKLPSMYSLFADSEDLKVWASTVGPWSKTAGEPFEQSFDRHVRGLTKAAIDYFFEDARQTLGKQIVGDKTPAHTSYLAEIQDLYPDARVIHVIRDGRDQAVSSVFHWWKESEKAPFSNLPPEVLEKRAAYHEDKESYGAHGLSIFEESYLRGLARGWRDAVTGAIESGPEMFGGHYLEVRYEDLLEAPETHFANMMQLLGASTQSEIVERCVETNSFEQQAETRKRGTEDPTSFFRKGVAGDWRNYLTSHDRQVFKEEAGDLLVHLGYETDYDW